MTSFGSAYSAYHRDLELQRRTASDPFAEAVALFTNVENGAGIFASYASTVTRVTFQ